MISYKRNYMKAFDTQLYKRVLDPIECNKQLTILSNSTWALPFLDATAKPPSGILTLNLHEYGDYFECLAIDHSIDDVHLQGKYCIVGVPLTQYNLVQTIPMKSMISKFPLPGTKLLNNMVLQFANIAQDGMSNSSFAKYPSARVNLGVCVPRPCTVQEVYSFINSSIPLPNIPFKEVKPNRLLSGFSIYSNTRSLLTFRSDSTTLECVDGIRALSMLWVICGHTYIVGFFPAIHNGIDTIRWSTKTISSWIHAAPMMVDTYFLLSGIFCIYGKPVDYTAKNFIKSLPKFYIYRYLRLFPLLAATVLLQASVLNWIADGPNWVGMAHATQQCRELWWATLLHIQNHYTLTRNFYMLFSSFQCLIHSWYVAVDTQLYFLSPIIIVFLFGSEYISWIVYVIIAWIMSLGWMVSCVIAIFKTVKTPYELDYFDITLNAIMRPLWGLAVAWIIFACVSGYGGPVNWFLSLPVWKFPSRVSYAVYLVHFEVMILKAMSAQKTRYFTDIETMYRCASDVALSLTIAFVLCVLVDAPVNRFMRIAFASKERPQEPTDDSTLSCNERKTKL
ncbi:O-acyltransferase like protein-like [Zerene cesonia]|uniref:O-acyltransferase like protein-like n=1 Tax=Zerene cesonia TaxID=33412 RepID=UPI0018E50CE7|nr:O-acyltransferase like protein-like [Zerene cesonia]